MHDVQVKTARGLARGLFLRGGHPRPSNAHRQVDYPAYSIVILPTTLCTICSYLLHQKYPCVMLFLGWIYFLTRALFYGSPQVRWVKVVIEQRLRTQSVALCINVTAYTICKQCADERLSSLYHRNMCVKILCWNQWQRRIRYFVLHWKFIDAFCRFQGWR